MLRLLGDHLLFWGGIICQMIPPKMTIHLFGVLCSFLLFWQTSTNVFCFFWKVILLVCHLFRIGLLGKFE
jgi:hypothetical protein